MPRGCGKVEDTNKILHIDYTKTNAEPVYRRNIAYYQWSCQCGSDKEWASSDRNLTGSFTRLK